MTPAPHTETPPTVTAAGSLLKRVWFALRAWRWRLKRAIDDLLVPPAAGTKLDLVGATRGTWQLSAESRTALRTSTLLSERLLTSGKIENLRIAARAFNGLSFEAGEVFSFWRALGRPGQARGFVQGRELREGCMVASVGGGLCQLSNALYATALQAGFEIAERHAHSQRVPGSAAEFGRDATVFWNYVDLRFRASRAFTLSVSIEQDHLIVRVLTRVSQKSQFMRRALETKTQDPAIRLHRAPSKEAHDCVACSATNCIEHIPNRDTERRSVAIVDEYWPEFDQWLNARLRPGDTLLMPKDASRWQTSAKTGLVVATARIAAWQRGLHTRLNAGSAPRLRRGLLDADAAMLGALAPKIPFDAEELILPISMLRAAHASMLTGGRRVIVLMNRPPLRVLHETLNRAALAWPAYASLSDFRAPEAAVRAEEAALALAAQLVTPHVWLARTMRAYNIPIELLNWHHPEFRSTHSTVGRDVLLPASALARKGSPAVAHACASLGLRLRVLGTTTEPGEAASWQAAAANPFEGVGVVVLPAFVEHQPRLLLAALARCLPVIASPECGLPRGQAGVHTVAAGDAGEVKDALRAALGLQPSLQKSKAAA
jgi:hypothetical protein